MHAAPTATTLGALYLLSVINTSRLAQTWMHPTSVIRCKENTSGVLLNFNFIHRIHAKPMINYIISSNILVDSSLSHVNTIV